MIFFFLIRISNRLSESIVWPTWSLGTRTQLLCPANFRVFLNQVNVKPIPDIWAPHCGFPVWPQQAECRYQCLEVSEWGPEVGREWVRHTAGKQIMQGLALSKWSYKSGDQGKVPRASAPRSVYGANNVWMWELDHKESWAPKNWCFWTVVLEKTLESPLDCKEIQPVHPKGNQSWIFIGRTDAEAETPILWPPDGKNWLIWKDPDAGQDWRQEEKGMTEDEMAGWHHWLHGHEFG